nr:hypothetical protein [Kineococcus rubinsiae]
MAQVVQPDDRDAGLLHQLAEGVGDDVGAQEVTALPREHQAAPLPGLTPRSPLGFLDDLVVAQDLHGERVDRHDARAGGRLRHPKPRAPVPLGDLPSDDDVRAVQVNVAPVHADGLASPHAGEGDEVEEGVQTMVGGGVEEDTDVLRLPDGAARGAVLRELDLHRRVPGDEAALHRTVQGRTQGAVHVLDRGRRRRAEPVAEQVGVESVDVVGAQILQPVVPQRGGEVAADVHRVAATRRVPEVALGGQPLLEVLRDRERAVLPHAGLLSGDLRVQRLLCVSLGGEAGARHLSPRSIGTPSRVDDEPPQAAAAMRQELTVCVPWTSGGVTLPHGAPLHRCTPTRSSSGAVGTRMSLPSRTTGVGQLSVRISS